MSWNIYRFAEKSGGTEEFKRAARAAKEAIERMCELGEEMEERYSERHGMRDDYEEPYGERRGRDSMGRYR